MVFNSLLLNMKDIKIPCYKIVDLSKDGKNVKFLFHGVLDKTRDIPYDVWIQAKRKWAGEGGQKYWTGIHVFTDIKIANKYFKRFTDKTKKRIIVRCWGKGLTPKISSRGNVFLAKEIMVPNIQNHESIDNIP